MEYESSREHAHKMTNTIDWNAPLDGTPKEVWREIDIAAQYTSQPNNPREWAQYSDRLRQALARAINELRNRAPQYPVELVERIRDFVCEYHVGDLNGDEVVQHIEAILPPQIRDLEMARDCVASSMHDRDKSWGDLVRAGQRDDCPEMRMVLAAIKRVRAEKG